MALADIWRTIAVHGLAGGAGVALWFGTQPPRSARSGQDQGGLATARERSVEVQLRGRDLAEGASEEHGEEPAIPAWVPRTARQLAEEALAKRDETIAAQQADAMVLVAAAGKFSTDKRLLEKIEEALFTGDDDEAAAMMLAFVLQDEERALAEAGKRGAVLDALSSPKVLAGVEAATLERWAAREDLPEDLRMRALSNLAKRMGPVGDLEGVARVWEQAADSGLREDFIKAFELQWICDDGAEAVGIIFHEWPEALRLQFLEKLDWFHDGARPIWTKTLVEAMRDAPWDTIPEDLAERVLSEIKRSDSPSDLLAGSPNVSGPLSPGLQSQEARRQIYWKVAELLRNGPDLGEQLADGRIDVDGLARRLASRIPGIKSYPAEFAGVVFEVSASIDPVGALGYSRGKIAPAVAETLGRQAQQQVEDTEWCLDRMLATSALLPASSGGVDRIGSSGTAHPAGDFVVWHSLAPERAMEALDVLPKGHPLRKSIEAALSKEVSR
jgi:hypothetical protein